MSHHPIEYKSHDCQFMNTAILPKGKFLQTYFSLDTASNTISHYLHCLSFIDCGIKY